MLPRPYAPIIPLGRGPCGHVSKAGERRRREEEEEEGGRQRERGRVKREKVAEELF